MNRHCRTQRGSQPPSAASSTLPRSPALLSARDQTLRTRRSLARATGATLSATASTATCRQCSTNTPTSSATGSAISTSSTRTTRSGRRRHRRDRGGGARRSDVLVPRRRSAPWTRRTADLVGCTSHAHAVRGRLRQPDPRRGGRGPRRGGVDRIQLAVLALCADLDLGRPGGPRLPPLVPRRRALESAVQPGRPRTARGTRPSVQGPCGRRNIAATLGPALSRRIGRRRRPLGRTVRGAAGWKDGDSEMVPYWVFHQGPARIERHVPVLPFSRDAATLPRLRKTLAAYRLAFGQPRQEELIEFLGADRTDGDLLLLASTLRIDLSPPERSCR